MQKGGEKEEGEEGSCLPANGCAGRGGKLSSPTTQNCASELQARV